MLITTLLIIVIGLIFYLLIKIIKIHLKQFETQRVITERVDNLYTQIDCLLGLQKDLALSVSLPPMRGWAGSPDFLRHLHHIARTNRPECVVECSSGTSTVVLARTAQMNGRGHVFSLEHDREYAAKTRIELARQDLESFATVIDAPLVRQSLSNKSTLWYDTQQVPAHIDMLVIDGPPWNTQPMARFPAIPLLDVRLGPKAIVVLDDASRPDEQAAVARWCDEHHWESAGAYHAEKGIAVLRRKSI